ncbi:BF3164 family lipoprotein [Bacteroides fragilis]|uniref:BF3164 family lipoprotein n=1 Tax=Bacteroides fragilis TaxID=817 RepID=UPI0032DA1D4B
MKYICFWACILPMILCSGCSSPHFKEISLNDAELGLCSFCEFDLDSTNILYPRGLFYFDHHLILVEVKNNPTLSFWTSDSLKYEFSSGYIGGGPNELIRPRADYFTSSDSSFFILDSDIEREIKIENRGICILNNIPIAVSDAINQLVRLDHGHYIMSGKTDGASGKEHFIYSKGEFTPFGDYPSTNLEKMEQAKFDYKFTAGKMGKKVILDFYLYHNLIRKYSIKGELLQEIRLQDIPDRHNTYEKFREQSVYPCWRKTVATDDAIYVLFYQGVTEKVIYSEGAIPELQVWDWEGKLKKRFLFDKIYDNFTVSPDGRLYALNTQEPYKIYTYEVGK